MTTPTPLKAGKAKINPYPDFLVMGLFGHQLCTVETISDAKYALKSNNTSFCMLVYFFFWANFTCSSQINSSKSILEMSFQVQKPPIAMLIGVVSNAIRLGRTGHLAMGGLPSTRCSGSLHWQQLLLCPEPTHQLLVGTAGGEGETWKTGNGQPLHLWAHCPPLLLYKPKQLSAGPWLPPPLQEAEINSSLDLLVIPVANLSHFTSYWIPLSSFFLTLGIYSSGLLHLSWFNSLSCSELLVYLGPFYTFVSLPLHLR